MGQQDGIKRIAKIKLSGSILGRSFSQFITISIKQGTKLSRKLLLSSLLAKLRVHEQVNERVMFLKEVTGETGPSLSE